MITLEIFDPPMCCATGACSPDPDPRLPQFAADLEWLAARGVCISRYNMAHDPAAFVANTQVRRLLDLWGESCLPVIVREDRVAARGRYPTRHELAGFVGLTLEADPA